MSSLELVLSMWLQVNHNEQSSVFQYMLLAPWNCLTYLQPFALADNLVFCNSLVAMWPKTTTHDLLSTYNVKVHIHNEFVKHMKGLKEEIAVRSASPQK